MKKLLILPLLLLLGGCVQYYYPETALEDGVYYAEDDPKYVVYEPVYYGAYYPWASLDYFYWGYMPYPLYTYSYYYGFPFGILYADMIWSYRYPYYGGFAPYHGHCGHYGGCGPGPRHGSNRYARNESVTSPGRDDDTSDLTSSSEDSLENLKARSSLSGVPYRNIVSMAPAGYSGNRGMVMRSNENAKVGQSRVQPTSTSTSTAANGIVIGSQASGSSVPVSRATPSSNRRPSSTNSSQRSTSRRATSSRPSSGRTHRSRSNVSRPITRAPKMSSPVIRERKD